eukprot:scaffold325_cov51-Isochrysis_galbana.AAC.1
MVTAAGEVEAWGMVAVARVAAEVAMVRVAAEWEVSGTAAVARAAVAAGARYLSDRQVHPIAGTCRLP